MNSDPPGLEFSGAFDEEVAVGGEGHDRAYFGRDVLRGLVSGIDEFVAPDQTRWKQFRAVGPALLGSALWINDEQLIDRLTRLTAACVVVTKQQRKPFDLAKLERLRQINERGPGLPQRAFPALGGMAPKVDGRPRLIGPYDRIDDARIPTVRTLGFRRSASQVPLLHAKLALLGHLWWHDEGPLGHVEDVLGFTPRRLWVSSANFTSASRHSLEFGYWTEDAGLMTAAERFLTCAVAHSEGLDPDSDESRPDLAMVEYDDAAMFAAIDAMEWDEDEE